MTKQLEAAASTVLILLGIDADNKAHASRFKAADRELVLRAAGLMAYRVIELTADEAGALKIPVPEGKIFATGRAFVPFVKQELYDLLVAKLGTSAELAVTTPPAVEAAKAPVAVSERSEKLPPSSNLGALWSGLVVGNMVLARDDENESWFEAIVVSVADDDKNVLRLRWRDYPEEGQFKLHRGRVAILGPNAR